MLIQSVGFLDQHRVVQWLVIGYNVRNNKDMVVDEVHIWGKNLSLCLVTTDLQVAANVKCTAQCTATPYVRLPMKFLKFSVLHDNVTKTI